MSCKILVVEDEIFVAIEIEYVVSQLGHLPVGIAADSSMAEEMAGEAEVALVDLNLRDGPTGPAIGRMLAEKHGVTVVFVTANPAQLGDGIPGTLGVIAKPVNDQEMREAVRFAVAHRHNQQASPPPSMRVFANSNSAQRLAV
jgi:DNA-binding response OmpR family regulator